MKKIYERHNIPQNNTMLQEDVNFIIKNLNELPITQKELEKRNGNIWFIMGEYYFYLGKEINKLAAQCIDNGYSQMNEDWYDHRLHLLTDQAWSPFWTMSADHVMRKIPSDGKFLNLCAGDCFYDYHYYSKQASEVWCIDRNQTSNYIANRVHKKENMKIILSDIFNYQYPEKYFDTICIRGAIEHFNDKQMEDIINIVKHALKDNGWFVGDTPKATHDCVHHIKEFENEEELKQFMLKYFRIVETNSFKCGRDTLFWACQTFI